METTIYREDSDMELNPKTKEELEQLTLISSKIAADALARMINMEVKIDVPYLRFQAVEDLNALEGEMIFSLCDVTGDVKGGLALAFVKEKSLALIDMLMYQNIGTQKDIDVNAESVFNELTNIIGGAYISAMANHLSFKMLPAPPIFITDVKIANEQLIKKNLEDSDNCILLIKTNLYVNSNVEGSFYLALKKESLNNIIELLNSM